VGTVEIDTERRSIATGPARSPGSFRLPRWMMVAVAVGALTVATGGFAFAGALPPPAQDAVSKVLDRVGITVPSATDSSDRDHPASTGQEISTIATTTDATGVAKGAEISTVASGGMSQAGEHGSAAPTASGEHGAASDEHAGNGRDIAAQQSNGHSSAGS
jgi:hypothetical protein